MKKTVSEFELGDMLLTYVLDENDRIGMEIIPLNKRNNRMDKAYEIDSLVQMHIRGDDFGDGFENGLSMRNAQTTCKLKYEKQTSEKRENTQIISTVLRYETGLIVTHILSYETGAKAFKTKCVCQNESDHAVSIEMLSSFSMGAITPFVPGEAANSIVAHRVRSFWSVEGRLDSTALEDLQLEPSWSRFGVRCEKFGQTGSMPVRKYFPFIAAEDTMNHVIWAAQIACPSSWQIELYRRDDALCLSGGLADYDFGHWMKTLEPCEQFETPEAILTVACGGVNEVSQRLLTAHEKTHLFGDKLPVVFNEFCTTWGKPSHENIKQIVNHIKGKGIRYFVIDAGWYADKNNGWELVNGDWVVSSDLFPFGLEETVRLIKEAGMIPGIWFEFETSAEKSMFFKNQEHMLKRNGTIITSGRRSFLDMREAWVDEYLTEKVISMLKKYGFQYIKIDYNESIGIGCDGAESLGEGLRQNMLASQAFFKKIRAEIPDIVIESCSSGGHRLEPSMMSLCDLASFSDAHECREIPIIASNLHRMILPGKSLIWAVLRKTDTLSRIAYSMINTFLGVMCLSGDIYDLNDPQWKVVDNGIRFYNLVSPLIANGTTQFYGSRIHSVRFPEGWQGILRFSEDRREVLAVIHQFGGALPSEIKIALDDAYDIRELYSVDGKAFMKDNLLTVSLSPPFSAIAIYLAKEE